MSDSKLFRLAEIGMEMKQAGIKEKDKSQRVEMLPWEELCMGIESSLQGGGAKLKFVENFLRVGDDNSRTALLRDSSWALRNLRQLKNVAEANEANVRTACVVLILNSGKDSTRVLDTLRDVGAATLEDLENVATFQETYIPFKEYEHEAVLVLEAVGSIMRKVVHCPETVGTDGDTLKKAIDAHRANHLQKYAAVKRPPGTTGLSTFTKQTKVETHPAPASEPRGGKKKAKVEK